MVKYNIISTGSDGNATILEDFVLVRASITVWIRWTALTGMLGTGKTSSGPLQLAVISMRMTTGRGVAVPKLYRFAG